ncbi:T-cell-specific surface glycoprotein CD28 isoform X2 [Siniperca chuatsi]|uniref:T-cell-specific surface glycoprotein CD28 isoform X2 n=1 Tax=Siniperca chuatsi TaxID=119488 RepID=UPI001CE1B17F|nr:T-cell-specific surface glycoprotein CD28 isoform X2 [Siniperca chuatsi]
MSACWMFMIFMGYRLSHAAQSQGTCTCKGHQCKHNKDCSDSRDQNSVFPWIWILVVLLIIIYSIIVTIIAFINWVKLRRTDSQSDYMNTKPRAPRDRKKKRGVQTPIPRHF